MITATRLREFLVTKQALSCEDGKYHVPVTSPEPFRVEQSNESITA